MTMEKLSVNRACIAMTVFLSAISAAVLILFYHLTGNMSVVWFGVLYFLSVVCCMGFFIMLIRRKLLLFSDALCEMLDNMLSGDAEPTQTTEEESLFYKISQRLVRLYEAMRENRNSIAKERADLQELISDISHQVKTPVANLRMINSTLIEQTMPEEKRRKFLIDSASQIDKLDFLMQAMVKTSRLEAGVIVLKKKIQPVYDTLAAALGGILMNAEKKNIHVRVDCPEHLTVSHDRRWTGEVLFNILDNAVKYTLENGNISVAVEEWECYLKISIADTGKGIPEAVQGTVFRRFYREECVHDMEGIGIGLYLAREIITMQGGYIKVASEVGKGSVFSVFLLKE